MLKYDYSSELAAVVKQFLEDYDWNFFFSEDTGVFSFSVGIRGKIQSINYLFDVRETEMVVYGMCSVGADSDDREMMVQMAEFICRANYSLLNGCFEFDFTDGEIRYRSYIDCEEVIPSQKVLKNTVQYIALIYERYLLGILDIIFTNGKAADAISRCEKNQKDTIRSMISDALDRSDDDEYEFEFNTSEEAFDESDDDIRLSMFGDKKNGGAD